MTRPLLFLLFLLAASLLMGCSEARKMERKRLKAEALVKEAIETYPDIIKPVITTDTITLWTKGDVIVERVGYSQASMDSLVQICADLLNAEREKQPAAVKRLQSHACNIDTVTRTEGALDLKFWARNGEMFVVAAKHPEALDTTVTSSTRTIEANPCPEVKCGRTWHVFAFWAHIIVDIALVLLVAIALIRNAAK
jgi:hypothetical protein